MTHDSGGGARRAGARARPVLARSSLIRGEKEIPVGDFTGLWPIYHLPLEACATFKPSPPTICKQGVKPVLPSNPSRLARLLKFAGAPDFSENSPFIASPLPGKFTCKIRCYCTRTFLQAYGRYIQQLILLYALFTIFSVLLTCGPRLNYTAGTFSDYVYALFTVSFPLGVDHV